MTSEHNYKQTEKSARVSSVSSLRSPSLRPVVTLLRTCRKITCGQLRVQCAAQTPTIAMVITKCVLKIPPSISQIYLFLKNGF